MPAILDLSVIAIAFVAFAILWLSRAMLVGILKWAVAHLGGIPYIGGKIVGALKSLEQFVNNELTSLMNGVQGVTGRFLSFQGRIFAWLGEELVAMAQAIYHIAWSITGKWPLQVLIPGLATIRSFINRMVKTIPTIVAAIKHIEAAINDAAHGRLGRALHDLLGPIAARISHAVHWIATTGKWLYHEVAVELPHDIAGLRSRAKSLEADATKLYKWIRAHPNSVASAAFVGAVAWAIARLGAGWVRCVPFRNNASRLCRMDTSLLEALLLGTTAIFGAISIVTLAEACLAAEDEILKGIKLGFRELQDY